jgi:hypothetical protein
VSISSTWDTDADWNNYQSKTDITVSGGALQLTEMVTIPDSIVLLDDWADGNLESNRDDYNTTAFQPTTSTLVDSGAEGSLSRPGWTVDEGSPVLQTVNGNEVVTVRTSSSVGDKIRHSLSLASLDNVTWEMGIEDRASTVYVSLTANSTTYRNGVSELQDGYALVFGSNSVNLLKDNGGTQTDLINETGNTTPFVVRVERDASGNWELFIDGTSIATANDTTFTTSTWTAFASNDGISAADLDVNFYAVDDGS